MDSEELLITGIGGVGCIWARNTHSACEGLADLLLIDGDSSLFEDEAEGHMLSLGEGDSSGCAALAPLAEQRMLANAPLAEEVLKSAELVVILTALGGGSGSGASAEFARQARRAGCLTIAISAMPFECQPLRTRIAEIALERLRRNADVCIQVSLDRLAWRSRERGVDWLEGSGWVEDLAAGLIQMLAKVGLINLDLMDLRSIVRREGGATMFVAEGDPDDPEALFAEAMSSPLAGVELAGADGCLLQVEGGPDLTLGQVDAIADAFTIGLHHDAQVIFGARVSAELEGTARVVAVVSGLSMPMSNPELLDSLM